MAKNDKAVFIPGTAHFYTAAPGTAAPTKTALKGNRTTALQGWTEIGHTSVEKLMGIGKEGGEVTVKASMQSKALRTVTAPVKYSLNVDLLQFDEATLKHYLGGNAKSKNDLVYAQSAPTAEQFALLIVAEDGDNVLVLHAPKADVSANGDLDFSSTEDFAALPVKFTFLDGDDGAFGMGLIDLKA